jgi:hypothetical protein
MGTQTLLAAGLGAMLLGSPAHAQVTIQSLGDNPVTIERGEHGELVVKGGAGASLRVGQSTINAGGGIVYIIGAPIDGTQFLKPSTDASDQGVPTLSVEMRVSRPFDAAPTDRGRIETLVASSLSLSAAMAGQCELAKAAFHADCEMSELSQRNSFDRTTNGLLTANVRGEFRLNFSASTEPPAASR